MHVHLCSAIASNKINESISATFGALESSKLALEVAFHNYRLAIVGASYIACEQATIYNNLGTEVHMFNRGVRYDFPSASIFYFQG